MRFHTWALLHVSAACHKPTHVSHATAILSPIACPPHEQVRWEWLELAAEVLWDIPLDVLKQAVETYTVTSEMWRQSHAEKWRAVGSSIDMCARYYVIPTYLAFIMILFQMEFGDDK